MKRILEVAAVQIVAHQNALLQQPDPQLKGGFHVPSDMSGSGYTDSDWRTCWQMGWNDFADNFFISQKGLVPLPSEEERKRMGAYITVNRLDPSLGDNFQLAYDRLTAAGIISTPAPAPVVKESQEPKQQTPAEFAKEVAQAMERIDTRTPAGKKTTQ